VSAAIKRNARSVRVQIRIVVYSGGGVLMSLFYNIMSSDARAQATTPICLGSGHSSLRRAKALSSVSGVAPRRQRGWPHPLGSWRYGVSSVKTQP
jgi:hypothetical protein